MDVFFTTITGSDFKVINKKIRFTYPIPMKKKFFDLLRYLECKGISVKRANNMIIFKLDGFSYSILNTGHVNVTGLRKESDVFRCVYGLHNLLPTEIVDPTEINIELDNLSVSGQLNVGRIEHFSTVMKKFCQSHMLLEDESSWDPERFAGYTIRTPLGTLIVFATGAVNIMGVKHFRSCEYFESLMDSLIRLVIPHRSEIQKLEEIAEKRLEARIDNEIKRLSFQDPISVAIPDVQ